MKKIRKIIAAIALFSAFGAAPNVMAEEQNLNSSQIEEAKQQKELIKELVYGFNQHADELTVSVENPYKEVRLSNDYTIFAELTPGPSSQVPNAKTSDNITALAEQSNEFTTTLGYKNAFGMIEMQLVTTTKWTYNYDKVLNGTTNTIAEPKMIGWQQKNKSVSDPFKAAYDKEWEWTANGVFSYNIAGVEMDTLELITHHKVWYNGQYAFKHEVVD